MTIPSTLERIQRWAAVLAIFALLANESQSQMAPSEHVSAAPYFLGHDDNFTGVIPSPPPEGSAQQAAELAELHAIQSARTPAQLRSAETDDAVENVFLFSALFGDHFNAQTLPRTAALFTRLQHDVDLTEEAAKVHYARLRPYAVDPTIVGCPVATSKSVRKSYPSGHAMTAFSEAIVLARLIPERSADIMARARDYGENRLVCGAHYASDVQAGQTLGTVVALDILRTQEFALEYQAARNELQIAGFTAR